MYSQNDYYIKQIENVYGLISRNGNQRYFIDFFIYDTKNFYTVRCISDIVIVDKNGKIQLIDIKTITYYKNLRGKSLKDKPKGSYKIHRSPTKEQKRLGIKLMMVDYDW